MNEGEIYIIGGHLGEDQFSDKTISFKPQTGISVYQKEKLNKGRQLHSCSKIDGGNKIVVVGGRDGRGELKSVEIFDIKISKWIERKDLEFPVAISYSQMVPHSGKNTLRCFLNFVSEM